MAAGARGDRIRVADRKTAAHEGIHIIDFSAFEIHRAEIIDEYANASGLEDLVAFIANKSNGMKIAVPLAHPKEQEMAAVGEELFYRRGGVLDFACATCHAEEGKRIRLQGLPNLSKPGKLPQETMASWPTYRVSQGALRTMQHRLWDCYRQQRWPAPEYGSDAITALTVFLNKQATGGEINVPSIKR